MLPSLVYDGSNSASIFTFIASNLSTGAPYTFTLSAVNFNGEGTISDPVVYTACTAPIGLSAPIVTLTTETTIDLVWTPPGDDGGCALIGYELYLDNGLGGSFVNTDSVDVMYKPYLKSHRVTMPGTQTGKNFRVYLRAVN